MNSDWPYWSYSNSSTAARLLKIDTHLAFWSLAHALFELSPGMFWKVVDAAIKAEIGVGNDKYNLIPLHSGCEVYSLSGSRCMVL